MLEEKQNLKPGYFNQKPLLKAVSDLKFTIGLQDSCIQTNQAAILFFEDNANKSGDLDNFIRNLCLHYKISLGTRDLEYFKTIQYKSYILQTYNLLEPFFKEFNSSYRYYNNFDGNWKTKVADNNLDPFNQLLENIDTVKRKKIKSYPEYYLLDYYRLVRNSIVHLQEDENQHKKTSKYYSDNLSEIVQHFKNNYELEAPNEPDKIGFADFMLYTRSIKYFSNILNDVCFPSVSSFVIVAQNDVKLQKKLLQSRNLNYKGALLKRINVLRGYFHKHFNQSHKELRDEFCRAYLTTENVDYSEYL